MRAVAMLLFVAVLVSGMVTLVVVLAQTGTAGAQSLETWADPIRAGGAVSAEVAGAEADALTQALRTSKSISVSNFQAQSGTACFWADLGGVEARFVMREAGEDWQVVHASLSRECECPESADEPCRLDP